MSGVRDGKLKRGCPCRIWKLPVSALAGTGIFRRPTSHKDQSWQTARNSADKTDSLLKVRDVGEIDRLFTFETLAAMQCIRTSQRYRQ